MNITSNICLLVISCDKYSDLWPIFFDTFTKSWEDCPFDKYLISNYKSSLTNNFKTIKIGKDESWSDNLIYVINKIENAYDYAILFMEDGFITNVKNKEIINDINKFVEVNGNYLTLINEPKPTIKFNNNFGEIERGAKYRSTATFAVWRLSVLKDLLIKGETAWEFEVFGSQRSEKYPKFYSVHDDRFSFIHGVIKGKWLPSSVSKILSIGYDIDFTKRPQMGKLAYFRFKSYIFIRLILLKVLPSKLVEIISNIKWSQK